MATNIGDSRLCIHINIDELYKKALVFAFNDFSGEEESFDGFVDYSDFKDIGIHLSNIRINTCSRFVFLTRSRNIVDNKWKFWLNLLCIAPYNVNPQACFFRSSKVFYMSKNAKFEDIINKSTVFTKGSDVWIFKQYSYGFHHTRLTLDHELIQKDEN
jgi:hypothetical protein